MSIFKKVAFIPSKMYLCVKISYCNDMTESKLLLCHVFLPQVSRPLLHASSSPSTERRSWTTQEIWAEGASATASSWHGCVSLSSWSAPYYTSTCARSSERKKQDGWKKKKASSLLSLLWSSDDTCQFSLWVKIHQTVLHCTQDVASSWWHLFTAVNQEQIEKDKSLKLSHAVRYEGSYDIDTLGDECSTCSA